ncbi:MAG: site-specific integrase [Sphingobacteriales bacterium]|nr:MAG: site-specific integrase [Sphingobacteriales bacterium]
MAPAFPYGGQQPMPMLSIEEAIKGYVQYKKFKGKDPKTLSDIELSLKTLSFVRPDIQYVHQITKRLTLEYETLVAQIPANYQKTKALRNLSFPQLHRAAEGRPRLSPASVDKYTLTLRAFINWCQDTDLMPNWKLPRFEGRDKGNSKDKRHPFTSDELKKLLKSPQFTGHAPDLKTQLRRHLEGESIIKDHNYWVPLIGLYTGMRLREIVQLLITDVRIQNDVTYLDLNENGEGKSLKNNASHRQVPVHTKLIELGFLEYVERLRAQNHARVFPHAKATAAGAPADIFSKHFGRYLKAIGIKHSKLSFHSLRHTFIDKAAHQAKLPDHIIKALVGHADQTITFGTYGGRLSVADLAIAQSSISYEEIHK